VSPTTGKGDAEPVLLYNVLIQILLDMAVSPATGKGEDRPSQR
jgi:hypothetical protein